MDNESAKAGILEIQEKIFQALRIKNKIEERKQFYFHQLDIKTDQRDLMTILVSLDSLYEKERKVISICINGLENTEIFVKEINESIKPKTILSRIKLKLFKFKLLLSRKESKYTSKRDLDELPVLIRKMFSLIMKNLHNLSEGLAIIKSNTDSQRALVKLLLLKTEEGKINEVVNDADFKKIIALNNSKLLLIEALKKKIKYGKFWYLSNYAVSLIKKHPYLASWQAVNIPAPETVVTTSIALATGLNPLFLPLLVACCYFVEWSPTLITIAIERKEIMKIYRRL